MIPAGNARAAIVMLAGATVLLAIGLAIEMTLTRPRLDEIRALEVRQAELLASGQQRASLQREAAVLSQALRVQSLGELRQAGGGDPVVYVGGLLRQARLRQQDLLAGNVTVQDGLRRSRFTVRVLGDYSRLLGFVRTLEQSPRPVTVDAFEITSPIESPTLEGKFEISVYDPVQEEPR